jgi:AcrR family transcriptional regulator
MGTRDKILRTARELTIEAGAVPSMDVIARAAGVSKGGMMHHFTSRAALVEGIAREAMLDMNDALETAAAQGTAVETWLRLSASREEAALYRAMSIILADHASLTDTLLQQAAESTERWGRLFAAETGDPVTATVVRLLGDGLLLNSLADDAEHDIDAILQWLDRRSSR